MRNIFRLKATGLAAASFLIGVGQLSVAEAFTLNTTNSSQLGWANSEVKFYINTSNCPSNVDVVSAFKSAATVWNGIATSNLKVTYAGTTTSTSYSATPTVYCETNFQSVTGLDQSGVVGAGAITTASSRPATGILILNASSSNGNIGNFSSTKLKIIMAHEIGHVLGLGHADDSTALMYYDATAKTTLNLSQDDVDGMTYLYPRDELGSDSKYGCGLVSASRSGPPSWPGVFVGFASVMAVWIFLRRPRGLIAGSV